MVNREEINILKLRNEVYIEIVSSLSESDINIKKVVSLCTSLVSYSALLILYSKGKKVSMKNTNELVREADCRLANIYDVSIEYITKPDTDINRLKSNVRQILKLSGELVTKFEDEIFNERI